MAHSFGFRSSALGLLAVVGALAGIGILSDSPGNAAGKPSKVDEERLLLRQTDLPVGYVNEYFAEGASCNTFTRSQDEFPALGVLVRSFSPRGCTAGFERLFTPPGEERRAALVFSGVMGLDSRAGAEAAWALVPGLLGRVTKRHRVPARVPTPFKVGAETRLFHTTAVPFPFAASGKRASLLAWRSGNVIATVVAISNSFAKSDATVAELAPRQQAHIRKPTPYTAAERFDGEVALDDPALDLPVYWLGRHFRPGGGIPESSLYKSHFRGEPRPEGEVEGIDGTYVLGPEAPLQIIYSGIVLDTWTDSAWPVFADSETARAITSWKCTKQRIVRLPEGTATIFGGYEEDYAKCPKGPPGKFTAWVELGGVTIVVNAPWIGGYPEELGPFDSFEAVEAIVRGLKLRPKPAY